MSAGGLARLGVRCADASTGMATIGVYCGAFVDPAAGRPGGGQSDRGIALYGNKALAQRDDEDILVMLEAYFNRHRKH
jgi:hypothetical protein